MLKSNGPRILPCGTPEMSGSLSDGVVFIRTAWYRKVKWLRNHSSTDTEAPISCNLSRSIWWLILSKAVLMSRRTMAVSFLSFYQWHSGFHRWSEKLMFPLNATVYYCPLCLNVKRPVASKYDMNCLCATRSQTFDRNGSGEIGLLLFGISWPISVFEYGCHFSYFLHSIALNVNCSDSG